MTTYPTLMTANKARQAEWDPKNKITLLFRAVELAGEAGEACNIIKKIERNKLDIHGSTATKDQLAEELADVVICAYLAAMTADIDLDAEIERKFNYTSTMHSLKTRLEWP